MLESGKIKRYVVYALGEIVLIAIGILIAWKINDLNEIRKNRLVELKIYESLYEELNSNLGLLDGAIVQYTNSVTRLQKNLDYVGLDENQISQGAKDSIVNSNYRQVSLLYGSVNSVVNTSKFEMLESETLKKLIAAYPSEIQSFQSTETKIKDIVVDRLQPVLEQHLSLIDLLPKDESKYDRIRVLGAQSNYSELLKSKAYQNSIIDRLLQSENLLSDAKILRSKTEIMATNLKQELD